MSDIVESLRGMVGEYIGDADIDQYLNKAADEIERLRARLAEAEKQADVRLLQAKDWRARAERLEMALKPFANAADQLDKEIWDDGPIEGSLAYVTGSHCRAARAALSDSPHKGARDE